MLSAFKSITNEISVLKIEWIPSPKTRLNLFEEDPDPGLKINSYSSVCQYRRNLGKIYLHTKREIEGEIAQILDTKFTIIKLEDFKFQLLEIQKHHLPKNLGLIMGNVKLKTPANKRDLDDAVLRKKVKIFVFELRQLINSLVEFIRHKIKIYKKLILPYDHSSISSPIRQFSNYPKQASLFSGPNSNFPKLYWNKTDNDLLELILALVESESIKTEDGKIKQNMATKFCEHLFNHPIKSPHIKINKLSDRIKNESRFMWRLDHTLQNRKDRLDNEKERNR
jgi:hypothetical protein